MPAASTAPQARTGATRAQPRSNVVPELLPDPAFERQRRPGVVVLAAAQGRRCGQRRRFNRSLGTTLRLRGAEGDAVKEVGYNSVFFEQFNLTPLSSAQAFPPPSS